METALPLFVGRDLDPARMSQVAAHLSACERCRGLHEELAAGRAFLEASPAAPLSEADYADLRRAVWSRIETDAGRPARGRVGRIILASAGLMAVALAAILILHARPEFPRAAGRTGAAAREEPAVAALPAATREEPPALPAPVTSVGNTSRKAVRTAARGAESRVVRIEFQTANPDVRIIWLVKKGETAPAAAPAGRNQEVS
jgi:anti-sigma factor RsiW